MTFRKSIDGWLPRREAAARVGKSEATFDNWGRSKNKSKKKIKFRMVGNRAYYAIKDLDEYLKDKQSFEKKK